ncbi:MAG: hypothetical protein M3362_26170, partial [Acidobacteriota bacterium]|nr:hypothetical protein [Acidobacteriota bacterium]
MNSSEQSDKRSANRFWTPTRVGLTLVLFALLSTLGISSCNSTDKSAGGSTSANAPQISMKVNGANTASQPANPANP